MTIRFNLEVVFLVVSERATVRPWPSFHPGFSTVKMEAKRGTVHSSKRLCEDINISGESKHTFLRFTQFSGPDQTCP